MTARLDLRTSWIRQPRNHGIYAKRFSYCPATTGKSWHHPAADGRFRIEGGEAVRERLHALPSALIRSILHIENKCPIQSHTDYNLPATQPIR